jgi:hypothetical protein
VLDAVIELDTEIDKAGLDDKLLVGEEGLVELEGTMLVELEVTALDSLLETEEMIDVLEATELDSLVEMVELDDADAVVELDTEIVKAELLEELDATELDSLLEEVELDEVDDTIVLDAAELDGTKLLEELTGLQTPPATAGCNPKWKPNWYSQSVSSIN